MQSNELKAFMVWDGERHPSTATALPMPNGNFSSWTKQQRWEVWQARTQVTMPSSFEQVMQIHREMLQKNHYCYFELAYTRTTDWMVWVCSNSREVDPNRKVLLCGQGSTPEEASLDALVNYRKEQGLKNEID